jgi:hypothetical protein
LLPVARKREEQLGLERRACAALIEVCEERVVAFVEDDGRVETRAETLRQESLADRRRPFDGDMPEQQAGSIADGCDSMIDVRIERIELRVVRLPLVRFFETSFGRIDDRRFVVVQVEEDGAIGFGECVADAHPFYGAETTTTAWHIINDFIAPLVIDREFAHPREIFDALAVIRGHNMAKAAVEMAAWDLYSRQQALPLSTLLGGNRTAIESGVSIGIQPTVEQLLERVQTELAAGYRRVKIKIKPG